MNTLLRQNLTALICVGSLIFATQSWAKPISTANNMTEISKEKESYLHSCEMAKNKHLKKHHSLQTTDNTLQESKISEGMKVLLQEAGGLRYVP